MQVKEAPILAIVKHFQKDPRTRVKMIKPKMNICLTLTREIILQFLYCNLKDFGTMFPTYSNISKLS